MPLSSSTLDRPETPEVERLRQMQRAGRHAEVLEAAVSGLARAPDHRDLLLILAISQRHLSRIDDALVTLERLEQVVPGFSRLHEERGMCFVARRDAPGAIRSLLQAVHMNAALPASWNMLNGLYRMTGDAANAELSAQHVAVLGRLPREVVTASALFYDGDLEASEQLIRAYLLEHGDHPEAMRLLARIGLAHDVLDDAETLLAGVLKLAPDYHLARYEYAQTLIKRQKFTIARPEVEQLLRADPSNIDYQILAATLEVGIGRHETAIGIYESVIRRHPDASGVHLWHGHALKTIGRVPEAIAAYRAAAAARPDFGDAYWSLANLKMYRFTDDELARMRAAESAAGVAPEDRWHLCFALGKALEDRGEFAESWTYYERGNGLKLLDSTYTPESMEANTAGQVRVCTPAFFHARAGWGDPRPDPIFIVGLTRAGSTLLEQILASHSQVDGTHELADVQRIVLSVQGTDPRGEPVRYPSALELLSAEDCLAFGQRYLSDTRLYRTDRPYFVDKMPNNFRHIGLIHLMLPNARIIDARREPMSCCFSNLKQLFAQGQEFSYGVENIARYYRTYLDLMEHWDRVLPGRVLRMQHEDVVDDLEASVRRLLDYCQLPFEPACLDFHKTRRSVRTPSSEQVRQPIFRDGLEQWRGFEPWLGPLQEALGDAVTRYR
jgi:tetratricopeptide (TPR) repeat protein